MTRTALAALAIGSACAAPAQSPPPYVLASPLLPMLTQAPENGWLLANANLYRDVWTGPDLEPRDGCCPQPASKIIDAWSGFGWDSNRGDLILWGGGHANYPGNDVYRWRSSTLLWERASLPSDIKTDPLLGEIAIDGVDNAPISSHTSDNNGFLRVADRFITWGGNSYNRGGPFIRPLEADPVNKWRLTGPYLFDPNRADGNKVGGTTGSHVQAVAPHPEVVGGRMWENRDIHRWLAGQPLPGNHGNGCAAAVVEGGRDVVYVAGPPGSGTSVDLFRYQLTDVAAPASDQIAKVGVSAVATAGMMACDYDAVRKLFVRTGDAASPLVFWDLRSPGAANGDQVVEVNASIAALQSWLAARSLHIGACGLAFDPVRNTFLLWCGANEVWQIDPPPSGNAVSGWSATLRTPTSMPAPPGNVVNGVLGKWRYAPHYDVFVGLQDSVAGNVWIYKPPGWQAPNPAGNRRPSVAIASPAPGITVAPATLVQLTATASDPDGTISRVEYYVNGDKLGQAASPPYAVGFAPIAVGAYSVTAVAVDNAGAMSASTPVTFAVSATLSTLVLQRGLGGYTGVTDTYLDRWAPDAANGALASMLLDPDSEIPLLRFAIFQPEGGQVPANAVVQSATLSLYKQYYDDTLQLNALLKPWVESEATWNRARAGAPWAAGGAGASGTDYVATADAVVAGGWDPGWVSFDVTARVRQWAGGANYGWRLAQATPGVNGKIFDASEFAADVTLRPKLTIVYSVPPNQPPTTAITAPAPGAVLTLGQGGAVSAVASDPDGSVVKVDFYANGVRVGTTTQAPFVITWIPSASGSYSLVAVATDNANATSTSAPVTVSVAPGVPPTTATLAIWRPATARFHIDVDFDHVADQKPIFGAPTDKPLAGRIDPGRAHDLALYRNGVWYADLNRDGVADFTAGFGGVPGDVPLLADFNGDGRDDLVVYRGGTWYVSTAQNGVAAMTFNFGGVPGDVPLAADVDGDGIADLVVYRNGVWYIDTNRDGIADRTIHFGGAPGDIPLVFDFDGDGKADLCIFRAGVWYVNTRLDGTAQAVFGYGAPSDLPLAWRD